MEQAKIDYEQLIYDWIQKHYPEGIDIYADYRDGINPETVQKFLSYGNAFDGFWEWLDEAYWETEEDYIHDAFSDMMDDLGIDDEKQYDFKDDYFDFFRDNCYCNLPADHFLKKEFRCNIFIDTGNWDYDCTCEDYGNNYYASLYKNDKISDIQNESSILWLARKQGYNKTKLYNYLYKPNYAKKHPSEFLRSVGQELENVCSHMNILIFAKHFTLEELLRMHTEEGKREPLKISKNTSCGLFDPFNGSGSVLEIELEKDMTIDRRWVEGIHLDDALGGGHRFYGIDDVYGMMDSFWARGDK